MSYFESLYQLEGKVAVVIGGTGQLCSQMALGLAQAGVEVILAGRNQENANRRLDIIRAAGGAGEKAYFVEIDLLEEGSLFALQDIVSERSGRIDILINGASLRMPKTLSEISINEFQSIIDINLTSTFAACQVFGQYFLEHDREASIINIGSLAGVNPISKAFAYSSAKAAVHNLTRNLAREWADHPIRVNTLVPGFFPPEDSLTNLEDPLTLEVIRRTPMSRLGDPAELIGATLLLSSNSAGGFMTGTEIIIDGGFSSMSI